jgi:hypothetical protein
MVRGELHYVPPPDKYVFDVGFFGHPDHGRMRKRTLQEAKQAFQTAGLKYFIGLHNDTWVEDM